MAVPLGVVQVIGSKKAALGGLSSSCHQLWVGYPSCHLPKVQSRLGHRQARPHHAMEEKHLLALHTPSLGHRLDEAREESSHHV